MDHTLTGFAGELMDTWCRRKCNIETDFVITGWICSVLKPVRADVKARMNGNHCKAVEHIVVKMLQPSDDELGNTHLMEIILNKFWE